jgi:protein-tyrosine phosphatase
LAGVSRSATITIAYLMSRAGLNFKTALTEVRKRRKQISPNPGFVGQLKKMGELLKGKA